MYHRIRRILAVGILLIGCTLGLSACGSRLTAMDLSEQMKTALSDTKRVQMNLNMQLQVDNRSAEKEAEEHLTLSMNAAMLRDRAERRQSLDMEKSLTGRAEDFSMHSQVLSFEEQKSLTCVESWENGWVYCETGVSQDLSQIPFGNTLKSLQDIYTLESSEETDPERYTLKAPLVPEDLAQILGEIFDLAVVNGSTDWDEICGLLGSSSMRNIRADLYVTVAAESRLPISLEIRMTSNADGAVSSMETSEAAASTETSIFGTSSHLTSVALVVDYTFDPDAAVELPDKIYTREEMDQQLAEQALAAEEEKYLTILGDYRQSDKLLLNSDGVRIYLERVFKDSRDDSLNLSLKILNSSDRAIEVFSECMALNGYMLDSKESFYSDIAAGEVVETDLKIQNMIRRGITEIQSVQVQLSASDTLKYGALFSGKVIRWDSDTKVAPKTSVTDSMEQILDHEKLKIWAGTPIDGTSEIQIPMILENVSDSSFSVDVSSIVDEDGSVLKGKLQATLMSGAKQAMNLTIEKPTLTQSIDSISEYVDLIFRAFDMQRLVTLFTTEPVSVYTGGEPHSSLLPESLRPGVESDAESGAQASEISETESDETEDMGTEVSEKESQALIDENSETSEE